MWTKWFRQNLWFCLWETQVSECQVTIFWYFWVHFLVLFLGLDLACSKENHQKTLQNTCFCAHQVSYMNMKILDFFTWKQAKNRTLTNRCFWCHDSQSMVLPCKTEVLGCPRSQQTTTKHVFFRVCVSWPPCVCCLYIFLS